MNIELSNFALIINVIIRIITAVIFLAFLIPLFIREAKVRNGLRKLRYQLLATGCIIFFVNTSGLFIIVARNAGIDVTTATDIISYLNTFGFFIYSVITLIIYTQQYTPENKQMHEKFEKFEKKEKGV